MIKKEPRLVKNYISPKREVVWIEIDGKMRRVIVKGGKFYIQRKNGDEWFGTTKEGKMYVFERKKGKKDFQRSVFLSGMREEMSRNANRTDVRQPNRRHIFIHCIFCLYPKLFGQAIFTRLSMLIHKIYSCFIRKKE